MASTIKIKHVDTSSLGGYLYSNNPGTSYLENATVLSALEDGELAYNAENNGLYIGYKGKNYLLSVANYRNPYVYGELTGQHFYGTADKAEKLGDFSGDFSVGGSQSPVYFVGGVPMACSGTLNVSILGNANTATSATTAAKLSKGYGSLSKPIYIKSDGTPAEATTFINAVSTLETKASTLETAINNNTAAIAKKLDTTLFNSHKNDTVIHITATERTNWNAKAQAKLHIWGDGD